MIQSIDDESPPDVPPSKWRLFLAGARRGARFGALVVLVIFLVVGFIGVVVPSVASIARQQKFGTVWEIIQRIGGFVGGTFLTMIYGAIAGALIMGFAAMFSAPPSEPKKQR